MLIKLNSTVNLLKRVWMMVVFSSILVLATACGSSTTATGNPVGGVSAQESSSASSASNTTDACTLLTKDDVSTALGMPVDTATSSGLGGVCTYTAGNLKIEFTKAGQTGGKKAMETTLTNLGDLALVVPGLGDQAFYNTNSGNALFLLKGDAEYLFNISDLNYQSLDPTDVQAKEKVIAEQLLSHLP
jgi:hypothetical protein